MKKYKFSELNEEAKKAAAIDYKKGLDQFRDAHLPENERETLESCHDLCLDSNDDVLYSEDGKTVYENES